MTPSSRVPDSHKDRRAGLATVATGMYIFKLYNYSKEKQSRIEYISFLSVICLWNLVDCFFGWKAWVSQMLLIGRVI